MWFSIWPHPTYHHPCQCHLQVSPLSVRKRAGSINPLCPALLYGNINQRQRRPWEERVASIKCVFEWDSRGRRHKKEAPRWEKSPHVQPCRHILFDRNREAPDKTLGTLPQLRWHEPWASPWHHTSVWTRPLCIHKRYFCFVIQDSVFKLLFFPLLFQNIRSPFFANMFMFKHWVDPNTFKNHALLQKSPMTSSSMS